METGGLKMPWLVALATLLCLAAITAEAVAASTPSLLRDEAPGEVEDRDAQRPTGGQPICMLGHDRKCGVARRFGPWKVEESPESPACSENYCVHWVPTTRDAPHLNDRDGDGAPNFVEQVLKTAEHSHKVYVERLGWRPPLPDGDKGGDARTDFYLFNTDLNTRAAALALSDGQRGEHPRHQSGWMILDDDYDDPLFHGDSPKRVLEYYVPHELHHIFQIGYDLYFDGWAYEATAEWITSVAYPHPRFFAFTGALAETTTQPMYRAGYRAYSLSTWNAWVARRVDASVIRRVWERADRLPRASGHHSLELYDRAIRRVSRDRTTFAREFARYAAATAEWSPKDFEAGNFFADIEREGPLPAGGDAATLDLGQAAWAMYDVRRVEADASRVALSVSVEPGTASAIALVGARGSRVESEIEDLERGGSATVSLSVPRGGFDRVTAVLINTETDPAAYEDSGKPRFTATVSAAG